MNSPATRPDDSEEQLRKFLSDRDVACPQCEYNLRDLKVPRCPECGEDLILRVNVAEPKLRLLIAGLIALSAGAGLNALLLIYLCIQLVHRPYGIDRWDEFVRINGIGLAVEGTALAFWLWQWRQIRRASLSTRIRLVILCWVLTGMNILFFSLKVR